MLIRLGHSPDPDDAFMFWGLAKGHVDPGEFEFEHVLRDIQTLNEWAQEGRLEVTAISLHTYPFVQGRYVLLPHGASMGAGYGPIVVSRRPMTREELASVEIAVPGQDDDGVPRAAPLSRARFPVTARCRSTRSSPRSSEGRAEAGLLIHEGQLTYEQHGLQKIVDLGEWWLLETGLPLPLGVNVARRDLGVGAAAPRSPRSCGRRSPRGSPTASEALDYALDYGRGLDTNLADRFVGMYVNELTQDYGEEGREAVMELLRRGEQIGAFPEPVRVEFIS